MSQSILRKNNRSKYNDDDSQYYDHTSDRTQYPNIDDENNTKLLYKKYPVIIGDFTLTKSTDEKSLYNYKPKRTNTTYVYQGIARSSEVKERARNEIRQYLQSSKCTQKKIPLMNNGKQYQSISAFPSSNYRSTTDDDLILNHSKRDSLYENLHRRNHSCSSLYPTYLSNIPVERYDPYYFGEPSRYNSSNEEEEEDDEESSSDDERCIIFGSNSQPKSPLKPIIKYSTFIPPPPPPPLRIHNDEDSLDVIFQEVVDVSTSTDDLLLYITLNDRKDTSSDQQQSLVTNQSSRSETEVYRVSRQNLEQNNYEEPDSIPFPTVKPPPSISTNSSSSTTSSSSNQNSTQPNNNIVINRSSKTNPIDEQKNYQLSPTTQLPSKPQQNPPPVVNLNVSKYDYVPINRESERNLTHKSIKSDRSRRTPAPKPPTVFTQTSDGFYDISSPPKLRPLSPSPSTDIDAELRNGQIHFVPSRPFRPTPGPYRQSPHPDSEDESDTIHKTTGKTRHPPKTEPHPHPQVIHEGTQSEEKSTRNVGTMHEPVQTRNFGNEVQPQSSSTQTSFPPKSSFVYIERPEPAKTIYDEPRISSRSPDIYYGRYDTIPPRDHSSRRSPSPQITTDYPYYNEHHSPRQPEIRRRLLHTPSPPVSYRCITKLPPNHPPISICRRHSPSPPRRSRPSSPTRRPHSAAPRYRPPMYSQETDTSLDAMKPRQHIGVQYEPRPTRETGTSPSVRLKKPIITNHRSIDTSVYPQQKYPTTYSSLPRRYDHSDRRYYIQPTTEDYPDEEEQEEEEEETPSMHDQSTMADLIVNLDHYTQCESQSYMADHYVQTTPALDEYDQREIYDLFEEPFIRQLPVRGSISITQPEIIQPPTLPRRDKYFSKCDGLDYTGKNVELTLHRGQQQRTTSIRNSPLLNIGTEHVINQSPTNEYTIPFETRYVYDSLRSSTLRSRSNSSIVVPVLNSPRTHLFTNNSIRQSRSNGNFYLSTAPLRALNSSFRLDITANES